MNEQPVSFIANRGQIVDTRGDRRPDVLYTASSQNTRVFVRANSISYVFLHRQEALEAFGVNLADASHG
ncbi:MAG: hypothetical protein H7X80_03540, partial [bacterium]|nr:hypothetical protein [Candidatus Kapabacteria bacterium]